MPFRTQPQSSGLPQGYPLCKSTCIAAYHAPLGEQSLGSTHLQVTHVMSRLHV